MKKLSVIFQVLAVILSDIMCAVVAYNYCAMRWGMEYAGYSAPPSTAFLYAVPYGIGIATCVGLAVVFKKKERL
ncbi:MAG: hypothetical protein LUH23_09385 [Oscillospiraceae bacterium]|nr:hypothetical protein [Oscillospiraceae bacterium]